MDMKGKVCPVPWQHMEVGHDHNMYLCCHIPTPVGNLTTDSVKGAWKSPKAEQIRESLLDGSYRYCRKETCPILSQPIAEKSPHLWWQHTLALYPEDVTTKTEYWPNRVSLANERSCNLTCGSCRNEHYLGDDPRLETVLQKIFNSGILSYAEILKMNGAGEFIHSPRLLKFLDDVLIRYPRLKLELLSNLTTFNAEYFYKLRLRHRVKQIWCSIDAAARETYQLVRGGNFTAVMKNLDSFCKIQKEEGFKIIASFVVSALNFEEIFDFAYQVANNRGIEAEFLRIQPWGHRSEEEFARLDVANENHPRHREFLHRIADPCLLRPHVKLGDLLQFVSR